MHLSQVDFDEFVAYYNCLLDRISEGNLAASLQAAAKAAEEREES